MARLSKDSEFYQGFAVALGGLIRDYDQPSMAVNIMTGNGVTLQMLKQAGVEKFDLAPISRAWNSEYRP